MFIVTDVSPYPDGPAGVHGVLPQAAVALSELAGLASLEAVPVTDVPGLAPDALAGGGVLALFTIGETPWTDACTSWVEYGSLVGARFDGHPWTETFDIDVDVAHPSTRHLGPVWRWRDEVYLFRDLRPDARVLLRVADGQLDMGVAGARRPEIGFPLAWCFTEGAGRVFYTSLGHFPGAWETPAYLRHLQGGLAWVLGDAD
jgi:type 1 glutamine amidotransferase